MFTLKFVFFISFIGALLFPVTTSLNTCEDDDEVLKDVFITENVIILVIDGPRYSETYGADSMKYIPNTRDSLMPQGVFFSEFMNEGPTYTVPGHVAITTGCYQNIRNNGSALPRKPSIFHYLLRQKNLSETDAWVISSKGKLSVLAESKDKEFRESLTASTFCGVDGKGAGYTADMNTEKAVERILMQYHPKLTLINLLEVDVNGHGKNWEGYLKGIQNTDAFALKLWNLIQNDPIYKNKTTLFITNDHGRHLDKKKDGFAEHGDGCDGCEHVSLLALGPDFQKGLVVNKEYELIDLAPTIGYMLKFDPFKSKGKKIVELLK
jgi:predicted AlkP superfamily pyrophosphatase or phosphodiesterase